MRHHFLILACLVLHTTAFALPHPFQQPQPVQRRPPPCQGEAPRRYVWPNSNMLLGNSAKVAEDKTSTVLASVELGSARMGGAVLKDMRIQDGRLVAPPKEAEGLVGALLKGADSDGQPVEVALCGAEPDANDPGQVWYRIEIWDAESASWKNPCIATARVSGPRALVVQGLWDASGARHTVPGKFTFACENGAIAKCITWGYKPWATKDGRSLEDLHQACTRMARADYCGNGRSHTYEDSLIDMYDGLGIVARMTESTAGLRVEQFSFEAAWTPEGASCISRTRDGRAVERVLEECPDRFEAVEENLGEGDRCTMRRKGEHATRSLLRNRAYGGDE